MNILFLNVNIGKSWGWGGIESHSDTLSALLWRKGHRVTMACWSEGTVAVGRGSLELPSRRITIRNSGDVRAIFGLWRICRRDKIDLVIANAGREYWPAAVAAWAAGAKVIFIRHQTDRIRSTTRRLINRRVDRVVAVSHAVRDAVLQGGVDEDKLCLIPNGVPLRRFDPASVSGAEARRELGIGEKDAVVGTVAKLHRGKGVYEMLASLDEMRTAFPRLRLLFVGDGPEKAGLEEEARRLSLADRVVFTGVRQDVERMYAAMDVFVLPSTCEEAFGMVLIEAMAMLRPVIGTAVGGIPDIIQDGINGLLVPPGNSAAISAAVRSLLEDSAFRERIAAEGRRTVEQRFSEAVMAEQYDSLLKLILNS